MVGYLPHCTFNLNPRAASIDTPLHAFVPHQHVDHMHPDAIIAIAAAEERQGADARRFSAARSAGCPWKRPGFELGLWLEKFCRDNPGGDRRRAGKPRPVHLGRHGQGNATRRRSRIINRAIEWFERETAGKAAFGGDARQAVAGCRAPRHRRAADAGDPRHDLGEASARSAISTTSRPCSNSSARSELRSAGRARHQLPRPFSAHQDPAAGGRFRSGEARPRRDIAGLAGDARSLPRRLRGLLRALPHADSPPMRDPNAVVYLVPGVGMITFAKDKATARIPAEFYVNAINVMRGASTVSTYVGPARAGSLRHRILAARGGQAAAHAEAEAACRPASRWSPAAPAASARPRPSGLLREGACVVLADIDEAALAARRG